MTSLVDRYLQKEFNYKSYNCFSFARDVWLELTGVDLQMKRSSQDPELYSQEAIKVANTLVQLESPKDPCLILFRRPRLEPHIGVYYHGRVLHLSRSGAYYMPLSQVSLGYTEVSFYR